MIEVFIDFEARSEVDLVKAGQHNYMTHPSTEPLCLGWAVGDGPVQITPFVEPQDEGLFRTQMHFKTTEDLSPLYDAVEQGALIVAHNAGFDRGLWDRALALPFTPLEQWACSAAASRHYGAPGALSDACEFLGLPPPKLTAANVKALYKPMPRWIQKRMGPKWREDPATFDALYEDCARDVEACRAVYRKCPRLSPFERRVWAVDQKINLRGVPVDLKLVTECQKIHESGVREANRRMSKLTKGVVKTTKQVDKIVKFLRNSGCQVKGLTANEVKGLLDGDKLTAFQRELLELRVQGCGAASAKYSVLLRMTGPDGRLRDLLVYYGARTGRWTSKDMQSQNTVRPPASFTQKGSEGLLGAIAELVAAGDLDTARLWGNDREVLDAMLRPSFCAPAGRTLMALDFGQIEARTAAWIADEVALIQKFKDKIDVYVDMATLINSAAPDRRLGKEAVLGLNFGMWADTFLLRCKARGIDIDYETALNTVIVYRDTYTKIVAFWTSIEVAVDACLKRPGFPMFLGPLRFRQNPETNVLEIQLPSGRALFYHRVERHGRGFRYWSFQRKGKKNEPCWIETWGSRWFENIVQATACCVFREALVRMDAELPEAEIVAHTHDDIMCEAPIEGSNGLYKRFEKTVLTLPKWAEGLPLTAEGWVGKRNVK